MLVVLVKWVNLPTHKCWLNEVICGTSENISKTAVFYQHASVRKMR